jgi:hypothetical protein
MTGGAAAGLAFALALPLLACGEDAAARQRRADARVLQRQIETLKELTAAVRENRLVDPSWLAVSVEESAFRSVIQAGLPQETLVAGRFRVRVESAEVIFRSGTGLVRLGANVVDEKSPDRQAAVIYQGGLDDITVGGDGRLHTRVLVDHIEVPEAQAAGTDAGVIASIADDLAGSNLETLQAMVPPVAIPVRLHQTLSIDGLGDGPVQVRPGELPVVASVARVVPLSGRLWVFLEVKTGPWRERKGA